MPEVTVEELTMKLWQAQQLIAAMVEMFGTQTPVGKVIDVPFADLESVAAAPQVMVEQKDDREIVRLRRG